MMKATLNTGHILASLCGTICVFGSTDSNIIEDTEENDGKNSTRKDQSNL